MFHIEMAGLMVRIENRYDDVRDLCKEYLAESNRHADIAVSVPPEAVMCEIEKTPQLYYDEGYCESVLIYERISNALPAFDAFVMHSSVVAVDGWAYAFAAESGIGKSTYTSHWKQVLGDRVTVINGDKPIYRFEGERLMAYGTPWCGKENWQTNTHAPLRALCLIERSEENAVYPVNAFESLRELMQHFHLPGGGEVDMQKLIGLIDRMVTTVQVYRLRRRNDVSAAKMAVEYFGL